MTDGRLTESIVEDAALAWFEGLGYQILSGLEVAPDGPAAERQEYRQVVLSRRLAEAVVRLNRDVPAEARDEAIRKVGRVESASLLSQNRTFHRMLVNGVEAESRRSDGTIAGHQVRLVDFDQPSNNDWLVVNQFTVVEGRQQRRPDLVVFVNGLALAVIELKNPADEQATIWSAHQQLQTYQAQIPALFAYNAALVVSDGLQARIGALGAGREWFKPWRTIGGRADAPAGLAELKVVIEGAFEPRRFLDLVRHFIVFEDVGGGTLVKKMAGYHQFHAVNVAVAETLRAQQASAAGRVAETPGRYAAGHQPGGAVGDRRVGVVWHTQGSGKSLTMAFYAGRLVVEPGMANPTILVLTDRNDLDDQLFGTFSRCSELLRQTPVQAESREELRGLLRVAAGGVVFTTVQKFLPDQRGGRFPLLSERRNIVVIADEAHRSQYDFIDGFARNLRDALPNASFIGFTGTPVEQTDANTRAVFGDYISVYDVQRSVADGATVPIYYESRLVRLSLDEAERLKLDPEIEALTESEELEAREQLKTKWAALEAVVGSPERLGLIARDLVEHYERRLDALAGKAMVVAMSRRICVDLYDEIVKLRPDWQSDDDGRGAIKVVMTGSAADRAEWQRHIRSKGARERLAARFKDPDDPFKVVIVRDMWLTGFDAPSLHTMYVDKPMRGHGLMQAIARVNRVFRDKPGGLIVDYLGLADQLRQALATYTESGGEGPTAISQEDAVAALIERYEVVRALFHGFDYSAYLDGSAVAQLGVMKGALEHLLELDDGKERFVQQVRALSQAFALAVPHQRALAIRDEVGFFQAARAALLKPSPGRTRGSDELDLAVRQIISRAVVSEEVVDIFAVAGLNRPDLSIVSDAFLAEVRGLPQRNLAVELLRKLLNDEVQARQRTNLVQARSFAELLARSISRYHNRAIETLQVIEELIALAKEMQAAKQRGERLGLSADEEAFYDALGVNDSAVAVLGDETLKLIAHELVETVRANLTIDWTMKENVRARLRVYVKRVLRRHGYPPDKQEQATQTVLQQAELFAGEWVA